MALAVESKFKVSLYDYQKSVYKLLLEGKDVFVCQKTGRGKSLCYLGYSTLRNDDHMVLVISPLNAIIDEQVAFLHKHGISAGVLGKCALSDVLAGKMQYIFSSPEILLGKQEYRDMLKTPLFQEKLGLVAVDEAHVVVLWGESTKNSENPFRIWFGRIGEVRSLVPHAVWLALTATASKKLRVQIKKKLLMNLCEEVADSPDRENIKLFVEKIKASEDMKNTFRWILNALKKQTLERTLIFCKTIDECSRIYHFLKMNTSTKDMSKVEMFHSMTPPEVKQHIAQDMAIHNGRIKLLACTNAAGMGVNYKGIRYVINYGPPQEMDTFVQHVGRAGRDGTQSTHLLMYHGRQLRNVDKDMLTYIKSTTCRRASLLQPYDATVSKDQVPHLCCDLCESTCKCSPKCEQVCHPGILHEDEDEDEDDMDVTSVSAEQKETLSLLLTAYFDDKKEDGPFSFLLDSESPAKVVTDIVDKICVLKTAYDVKEHTLISSFQTAKDVASIIENVLHLNGTVYSDSEDDD